MHGEACEQRAIQVRATGVVTRRSTDVLAVNDSDVSAALKYILRERGCGISVSDVANEIAISRRSLEKRFHKVVGRTVHDEIQRARLEHAKRLLLETQHPVARVATLSGFGTTDYFVRFFLQRVGMTPREFRGASRI
jgi:LacI family transcriptional regulator